MKLAEPYIYLVLGIISFAYIRRLVIAINEYRNSLFGLEKDRARTHMVSAAGILVLLVIIALGEFAFLTIGSSQPAVFNINPTPTLDFSATSTPFISQPSALDSEANGNVTAPLALDTPLCQPGIIEWTYPPEGEEVRGSLELKGTAKIENFGFYKYEYSQDNTNWNPLVVGTSIVTDDVLGVWDTSLLTPGEYYLRLVVFDNQENSLPPCVIKVSVLSE